MTLAQQNRKGTVFKYEVTKTQISDTFKKSFAVTRMRMICLTDSSQGILKVQHKAAGVRDSLWLSSTLYFYRTIEISVELN